jgi:CRISPR-associated protein Cmr6
MYRFGDDDGHIGKMMQRLLEANGRDEKVGVAHSFELTTLYPGLLTGSGYSHGLSSDYDAKIGFYFDHTSGLPMIPGSSVKGVLRSLFGLPFGHQKDPYCKRKEEMIRSLLGRGEDFDVRMLAEAIFEGTVEGKSLGMYKRDVFHDARVTATSGKVLADDYITPHGDPLKNPVPIRFLKVPGGVTFTFAFRLVDTRVGEETVTAAEKEELFFQLLQFHGIGAKTNVGYGQFEMIDLEKLKGTRLREKAKDGLKSASSDFEKIVNMVDLAATPKTLWNNLKDFRENGIDLDDKEIAQLKNKLEQRYGSLDDKFVKRIVKLVN